MTGFFILDMGVFLWLAIAGAALAGMAIETEDERWGFPVSKQMVCILLGLVCIGLIMVGAIANWGLIMVDSIIVLVCGLAVIAINFLWGYRENYVQGKISNSIVSAGAAFCCAVIVGAASAQYVGTLEYKEYSIGVEVHELEHLHETDAKYLARQLSSEEYSFQFRREVGKALDSGRRFIKASQVTLLEDDSSELPRVEGETIVMAKIDPISGRPLDILPGRTFQPTMLYVPKSEVWYS